MSLITQNGKLLVNNGSLTNIKGCCCGAIRNPCEVSGEICDCFFPTVSRSESSETFLANCPSHRNWTRGQSWLLNAEQPFLANNGWAWKEGYPQKLQGCRYRWLRDSRTILCCYAPFPQFGVFGCSFNYQKYTLYAVSCEPRGIVDITDEAVTKTPEYIPPNIGSLSDPSLCSPCGDDPGFLPPPLIEPVCPCSLDCDGARFDRAIVTINSTVFVYHDPENPFTQHCPPFYEEWKSIFEQYFNGTFVLEKVESGDTFSKFEYLDPVPIPVRCNNFPGAPGGLRVTANLLFSPTQIEPCPSGMSTFASLAIPATEENCQIAFDLGGGFRYTPTPGNCWLNSTDCRLWPGYQVAFFGPANLPGAFQPSLDLCLDEPQSAWVATTSFAVFGGQINSCSSIGMTSEWEVTLQ